MRKLLIFLGLGSNIQNGLNTQMLMKKNVWDGISNLDTDQDTAKYLEAFIGF